MKLVFSILGIALLFSCSSDDDPIYLHREDPVVSSTLYIPLEEKNAWNYTTNSGGQFSSVMDHNYYITNASNLFGFKTSTAGIRKNGNVYTYAQNIVFKHPTNSHYDIPLDVINQKFFHESALDGAGIDSFKNEYTIKEVLGTVQVRGILYMDETKMDTDVRLYGVSKKISGNRSYVIGGKSYPNTQTIEISYYLEVESQARGVEFKIFGGKRGNAVVSDKTLLLPKKYIGKVTLKVCKGVGIIQSDIDIDMSSITLKRNIYCEFTDSFEYLTVLNPTIAQYEKTLQNYVQNSVAEIATYTLY